MKNKKIAIIVLILIVIIAVIIACAIIFNMPKEKPEDVLKTYFSMINDKNYENLYSMISTESKQNISEEDFLARNENIYEGTDTVNINIEVQEISDNGNETTIKYKESMDTSAGKIEFTNTAKFVKEDKEYKIKWTSSMIFPELRDTDKVRVSTIESERGEILDRNGNKLAENGTVSSIGIVHGKLGENREQAISQISELTGVSVDYINSQLSLSWVRDDTFVPIKTVSNSETDLKDKLLTISGVQINSENARVYPLGEEAAHLIGYVQEINAEELEKYADKNYTSTSIIGKSGLEQAYEDTLRGIDGVEIYIQDEEGNKLKTLAKQDKQDGKDVKLTIDSNLQRSTYEQLKNDNGFFIIMNHATGEILSAVSTPTYDSNDFVLGLSNDEWNALNTNENKPLYNRFLQTYCPGSTFKPITAGIALTTGTINADSTVSYSGKAWQKDSSWGDYNVTTLTSYSGPKNVANALLYSDNIFFAQTVLQMGANKFTENLNNIGFNEELDFPLTLRKSQYSSGDSIDGEIKLADTGYGQGDLLVNPIHVASIYSAFANGGDMVKPYIEYNNGETEYYKENAFSEQAAEEVKNDLIQVVESPNGTAHDMQMSGLTIAGKTGTAELKTSLEDTESGTLGWFDCFTVGRQGGDLLFVGMVENTQNNSDGGSHYVISKIREILGNS